MLLDILTPYQVGESLQKVQNRRSVSCGTVFFFNPKNDHLFLNLLSSGDSKFTSKMHAFGYFDSLSSRGISAKIWKQTLSVLWHCFNFIKYKIMIIFF